MGSQERNKNTVIQVPLSGEKGIGKFAIVDDTDFELVNKYKWYLVSGYARTARGLFMHRLIMSPKEGNTIDHLNHNRLDNRKSNLRECSLSENLRNKNGKGYYYDKLHKYWVVRLGDISRCYKTEAEAITAAKLLKSGKVPEKRSWGGKTLRPKNISRNRLSGYFFQCRMNGKTYRKYGFSTIAEAVQYRDDFYKEKGIIC